MFELYLYNLYKNLDFYKIHNINKYSDIYKNQIHVMIGGNAEDNLIKIRELSEKIKNDIVELKTNISSNKDIEYIKIKKESFKLMKDLINFSVQEVLRNHNIVKQDIDKISNTVESGKFIQIQKTVDEINSMFDELLS